MFVLKDASTEGLYSFQFHYGIEIVRFGFISRSYLFLELTSTEEQGWRFLLKETTGTLIGLILTPDRHPGFKLLWLLKKIIWFAFLFQFANILSKPYRIRNKNNWLFIIQNVSLFEMQLFSHVDNLFDLLSRV